MISLRLLKKVDFFFFWVADALSIISDLSLDIWTKLLSFFNQENVVQFFYSPIIFSDYNNLKDIVFACNYVC